MILSSLPKRHLKTTVFLVFLVCFFSLFKTSAQVFPVQAYINVTPPYSVYLSQYTASDQEKIMATILLRDPVITSIDVKFRFTIQSSGIKLTTNPSWNPAPYNLVSGVSVILPQDIIADYLKPQHLLIEGIDQQEFYRSGKLPEGYYQFKVEVIEYRRNITISNTAQAGLWLMLNEPPRIVFPLPNQKVTATNPQMLNFTWVPGGVTSPQSSLTTQYEFTLVELTDSNVDPYIAITTASNATKYVKTLDQTSLFYGPSEMLLTPGKNYAIRVRAYTTDGFDMFKNNGYSDVRVFTFGDACTPPVSFSLQNPNQNSFEVSVMSSPTNTAWQARFRESSITDGLWSELKSEPGADAKTIKGLKASTSYDVQVKGLCGDIPSDYSQAQTIQTTEMVNANRSCSSGVSPFAAKDAPSLTQLKVNDVFLAALFPVRVKGIKSQGGGRFSGYGIATLPLFNTGLAVTFDNVGINDLMQLTSGEVKVVRDEFNITLFGDSQTTTTTTTTGGGTGGPNGGATYPPITDTITIPSDYDSIRIVDNNTILVYTPTGTQTYTVSLGSNSSTLVVPADHNMDNAKLIYDGAVHPYPQGQGNTMNIEPKNFTGFIAYFSDKRQIHGYDTLFPKISKLANYYKQFPVAGKQFYVPWKALKVDQPEAVDLLIKQGTDKLSFTNLKVKQQYIGDITPSSGAGTQNQTFTLSGSYKGAEDNVIAYYNADGKEQIAGGIYLATYGEERFKLILVPFPGVNISDVRGSLSYNLSAIYSQAVVSWSVDTLAGFPGIDLGSNGLDWADKDMLSSYNSEMNSTISAFKDWKANPDPNAYYLFVVPSFSQTDVEGYMPRNRRFGFITKDQLDARTIAHELGHGAFNLHHTFSANGWAIEQNSTNNLMDYAQGNKLWKPQWDLIHNPEATTGLFDGMEEGASSNNRSIVITKNSEFLPSISSLDVEFKINHGNIGVVTVQILNTNKDLLHEEVVSTPFKKDVYYLYTWDGEMNKINNDLISEEKFIISIIQGSKDVTHPDLFGKTKDEKEISIDYTKVQWEKSVVKTWTCINSNDYIEYKRDIENKVYDIGFDKLGLDADSPYRKNPLKYVEDNIVETSFLDNKIYVHKVFAEELSQIEKSCLDQQLSVQISSSFRIGNTLGKDKLSDHCLGLAIDINPSLNPYLERKTKNNNYVDVLNTIDVLCQISTGNSIMGIKDPIKLSEINDGFKEKYKKIGSSSKTIGEELSANFISLDTYLVGKDIYTYKNLSEGIIESGLNLLISNFNSDKITESEFCDQIKIIKGRISNFEIFNSTFSRISFIMDSNSSTFNKMSNFISDCKNIIDNLLLNHLKPINNVSISNDKSIEEYVVCFNKVQSIIVDFKTFGEDVKKIVNLQNDRGALVFEKGFFNIDLDLMQHLLESGKLDWGVGYGDYMHFNFKKSNIK